MRSRALGVSASAVRCLEVVRFPAFRTPPVFAAPARALVPFESRTLGSCALGLATALRASSSRGAA